MSYKKKTKLDKFIKYLQNNVSDKCLVHEWNKQSTDCYIYDFEEFNNMANSKKTIDILSKLSAGFCLHHKYFFIDKVGKYHSFNRFSDSDLPINWERFAMNLINRCNKNPYVMFLEAN